MSTKLAGETAQFKGTRVPILVEREPTGRCDHHRLAWDECVDGRLRCSSCSGVWKFDVQRARAALRWRRGRRRLQATGDLLVYVGLGFMLATVEAIPDRGWIGLGLLLVGCLLECIAVWITTDTFDG